jgi:hypothetical protein
MTDATAKPSLIRRCRFCGCTAKRACAGGCWWTGAALCSACTPSIDETLTAMLLVSGCGHITEQMVDVWSPDQRADAFAWAMALHQHASDNDDVDVPPRPMHTIPALQQQRTYSHFVEDF